jgi:hypothetical protein
MKTVIYEKHVPVTSWFALVLGFAGASAIILTGGRNVAMSMSVLAGAAIIAVVLVVLTTGMFSRRQLSMLSLENGELEARRFSLLGRGETLRFHDTETSNWRWKSKPAAGVKTATLAFTYRGEEYFMPFGGAKVVDHGAFKNLAPFLLWA